LKEMNIQNIIYYQIHFKVKINRASLLEYQVTQKGVEEFSSEETKFMMKIKKKEKSRIYRVH